MNNMYNVVLLLTFLVYHAYSAQCGTTGSTVGFQVKFDSTTNRTIFEGQACPGYDWTKQTTPNQAGQQCIKFEAPTNPIISTTITKYMGIFKDLQQTVANVAPKGTVGLAVNGISIYSNADAKNLDAYVMEGKTFDQCKGHNSPGPGMSQTNGVYHYHNEPASGCVYNDVPGQHSPLFAVMYDGVPVYGVYGDNGTVPKDLDECNGHVDSTYKYYHYHLAFNLTYPYTLNCLKGCLDNTNPKIVGEGCTPAATQYDYTPLKAQLTAKIKPFTYGDCTPPAVTNNSLKMVASVFFIVMLGIYLLI